MPLLPQKFWVPLFLQRLAARKCSSSSSSTDHTTKNHRRTRSSKNSSRSSTSCSKTGSSSSSGSSNSSSCDSSCSSIGTTVKRWLLQGRLCAVGVAYFAIWEIALLLNMALSSSWGLCLSAAAAAAEGVGISSCCTRWFPTFTARSKALRAALQQQQLLLQQRMAARASLISSFLCRIALTLVGLKPRVFGAENAAAVQAPCLVVCNHCGLIDILVTGGFLPLDHIRFISKHEVFSWPVVGRAMRDIGVVGFDRTKIGGAVRLVRETAQVMKTYKAARSAFHKAPVFLGFPEGSRSSDGRAGPPKLGLFQIASKLEMLVLPVSIVGAHKVQPVGRLLPLPSAKPMELHIHPAIDIRNKPVEEAALEVWEAVVRGLPADQQPLLPIKVEEQAALQ
uniref:Lysophosphatidic acid acyltransferase 2 n=1 Tax=Eimeria falciformis TaxID=84963 RepID=A0A221S601_9EIME|nr:lysophosphatidic acid acyltransferase 2 [Eimeria falciformis]